MMFIALKRSPVKKSYTQGGGGTFVALGYFACDC